MKRKEREQQKQLTACGFMNIPNTSYWITESGEVRDLTACNPMRITRPRTLHIQGKEWQISKAILYAFRGIPPRLGHVEYTDGNRKNITLENIRYRPRLIPPPRLKVDLEALRLAIRCYYPIEEKDKFYLSDFLTCSMLQEIANFRLYVERHLEAPNVAVFADWIEADDIVFGTPTEVLQNLYKLSKRDINYIVKYHINTLCAEIATEYKAGILELKPYFATSKERRRIIKQLEACGYPKPAPLRFPQPIKTKFKAYGITPPPCPVWGAADCLPAGSKLIIWLNRAVDVAYNNNAPELAEQIQKYAARINFFSNSLTPRKL